MSVILWGRPWLCVVLLFIVSRSAFGQANGPATQPVEGLAVESTPQAADVEEDDETQADQPKPPKSRSAYDFWTAKRLTGDWGGVRTDLEDVGFEMSLSYQQQWQQNFRGGLNTSNLCRNTGTYDLIFEFDFKKLGLIAPQVDFESGFYIKAKGSYNESIQDEVGSLFDPNTDPADEDRAIWVNKWWFWSKFFDEKLELRLGVLETVKDLFDVSLYANHEDKDFMNRASFRNVLIPHTTGMGAFLQVKPIDWWYLQAAAIDAQARQFHTQFDTAFHDEPWYLGFWETGLTPKWKTAKGPMPGRYRVGFWYDPTPQPIFEEPDEDADDDEEPDRRGDDLGVYFGLDQMVWKEKADPNDTQGLGLFTRAGGARGDINQVSCYWQVGASYKGLLPKRDNDVFGFSWANGLISDQYRNTMDERACPESVYEWYYGFQLTPAIIISPDFQVITNPGGNRDARDAIVGGIRLRIIF